MTIKRGGCRLRRPRGCVHIYTGDGKGKTSAALGLALRAAGNGQRVCMLQFLKGGSAGSGECGISVRGVKIVCLDQVHPLFRRSPAARGSMKALKRTIASDLEKARDSMGAGRIDILILDEVINAVNGHLLPERSLIELIETKPDRMELVLTGRGASRALMRHADYVSHIKKVKHPFDRGLGARRGIEF